MIQAFTVTFHKQGVNGSIFKPGLQKRVGFLAFHNTNCAAINLERFKIAAKHVTANGIKDDINALAIGFLLDNLDKIRLFIIDYMVGAELLCHFNMLRLAGSGKHRQTLPFGQLNRQRTDATGTGMD